MRAIRHRGQTIWPWTYFRTEDFANDYLKAVTGLTTDFPWHGSDLLVQISGVDQTVSSEEEVKKPVGTTRKGEERALESAELIRLQDLGDGSGLVIWRYKTAFDIEGENLSDYYLYSEPFILKITKPEGGSSGSGGKKESGSAKENAGKKNMTRSAPATGDRAGTLTWTVLFMAGLLGMIFALTGRRRRV